MDNFIAFDVETANNSRNSICQIGIVRFTNGYVSEKWSTLVQPNDDFLSSNIQVHGIKPEHVVNSPTFKELYPKLKHYFEGNLSISHTNFDIQAINSASQKYSFPPINFDWIDSCMIAQKAWPKLQSHSLNSLALNLRLNKFNHHDALDDALICGKIYLLAIAEKPQLLKSFTSKLNSGKPSRKRAIKNTSTIVKDNSFFSKIMRKKVEVEANPQGVLYGESIVFTGSLSISRKDAATLAAEAGCEVKPSVTKKISYVVVGEQDLLLTKGRKRSSKHRKAEEYISQGLPITILSEKQFMRLISE